MPVVIDKILADPLMHSHSLADILGISTTYLKLDASNDPLTSTLTIQPTTDISGLIIKGHTPYTGKLIELGETDVVTQIPLSIHTYTSDWNIMNARAEFFGGHIENVLMFGWNVDGISGHKVTPGEMQLVMAFETDYYTDAVNHCAEWYISYYSEDGLTSRRPFMMSLLRNTNACVTTIAGDEIGFFNDNRTLELIKLVGTSSGEIILEVPTCARYTGLALTVQDSSLNHIFDVNTSTRTSALNGKFAISGTATGSSYLQMACTLESASVEATYELQFMNTRTDSPSGGLFTTGMMAIARLQASTANCYSQEMYGSIYRNDYYATSGKTVSFGKSINCFIQRPNAGNPVGAGTLSGTEAYGVYIENQGLTGIANAYGLKILAQSGASTTNLNIYSQGGKNWFDGKTNMGDSTIAPQDSLVVNRSDAGYGEAIAFSLGGDGFGNNVGGALSMAWRYLGGSTVLGKIQGIIVSGGLEQAFFTYGTAALQERVRINKDGKVGINKTVPTAYLDIVGTTSILAILTEVGGTVLNENGDSSSDLRVEGDTDTNLLLVDASADKVGIGDSAPGEKLDVAGNANVTGVYKVNDVQVVSNRVIDARCDDAIDSGDATTDGVIDALRDAMITHGLIAAA